MASSGRTDRTQNNQREEQELYEDVAVVAVCAVVYEMELNMQGRQHRDTSKLSGHDYMLELLNGHPAIFYDKCRMDKDCFHTLCYILAQQGKLRVTRNMSIEEQVMIFLSIVGKNTTNSSCMEDYQHSSETISRYFGAVCDAICELKSKFIKPPNFNDVPFQISINENYYPFFKDCIGAIDGTHVHAWAPAELAELYRNRKGTLSQNVMAVCDFKMLFTYVVTGWEGSAHDSRILNSVLNNPNSGFPHPPPGKYYLVDASYANKGGLLAPYRAVPYHLTDRRRNQNGPQQLFNYRHASLRNVIERTFAALKKRFRILEGMNNYSLERQAKIAMACCVLHNFIRMFNMRDPIFEQFNEDRVYERNEEGSNQPHQCNTNNMKTLRDTITTDMWSQHISNN